MIAAPPQSAPAPQRVTFVLDDTYYQPVRKARKTDGEFTEEITSYGDFSLVTKFQAGDYQTAKTAQLSELLQKGHRGVSNPKIAEAIERIRKE